jgi:hypothetical protein
MSSPTSTGKPMNAGERAKDCSHEHHKSVSTIHEANLGLTLVTVLRYKKESSAAERLAALAGRITRALCWAARNWVRIQACSVETLVK